MKAFLMILVIVWFVFGVSAAHDRGFFDSNTQRNCTFVGSGALTVVAGPLSYAGVHPTRSADVPTGGSASSVPSQVAATGPHSRELLVGQGRLAPHPRLDPTQPAQLERRGEGGPQLGSGHQVGPDLERGIDHPPQARIVAVGPELLAEDVERNQQHAQRLGEQRVSEVEEAQPAGDVEDVVLVQVVVVERDRKAERRRPARPIVVRRAGARAGARRRRHRAGVGRLRPTRRTARCAPRGSPAPAAASARSSRWRAAPDDEARALAAAGRRRGPGAPSSRGRHRPSRRTTGPWSGVSRKPSRAAGHRHHPVRGEPRQRRHQRHLDLLARAVLLGEPGALVGRHPPHRRPAAQLVLLHAHQRADHGLAPRPELVTELRSRPARRQPQVALRQHVVPLRHRHSRDRMPPANRVAPCRAKPIGGMLDPMDKPPPLEPLPEDWSPCARDRRAPRRHGVRLRRRRRALDRAGQGGRLLHGHLRRGGHRLDGPRGVPPGARGRGDRVGADRRRRRRRLPRASPTASWSTACRCGASSRPWSVGTDPRS